VIFQVLTAVSTKMTVFRVVSPCSLTQIYRRFRDTYHHDNGHGKHIWNARKLPSYAVPTIQKTVIMISYCLLYFFQSIKNKRIYLKTADSHEKQLASTACKRVCTRTPQTNSRYFPAEYSTWRTRKVSIPSYYFYLPMPRFPGWIPHFARKNACRPLCKSP
jgi:hypothetical protein